MGPDGQPSFSSKLYPSSFSDAEIAMHSGFYDCLEKDDVVMFDKGGWHVIVVVYVRGGND